MQRHGLVLGLAAALLVPLAGCSSGPAGGGGGSDGGDGDSDNGNGSSGLRNPLLAQVEDFAYQLQGDPVLDLEPIRQSGFDLVVIDYSADGSDESAFTAEQIAALKEGEGQPKIVLAYMSIGEAEIGRFYFDPAWITPDPREEPDGPFELTDEAPEFLFEPNPEWPDNFKVRYWDAEWQRIVMNYLDRILDAGFDGVYLDIIDGFEFFGPEDPLGGNGERPDAASAMIDLVIAIAEHARADPGVENFLVFPQNGANIVDDDSFPPETVPDGMSQADHAEQRRQAYWAAIDGIGAEDTFYFGDADEDNPYDPQTWTIESLDSFHEAGLTVLAIDYLTQDVAVDDFYARARARGWVPYASIRDLSVLTINPTQPPD